jgi:hypothetical protein
MTVLINGQKMVDVQDNKHTNGPIALQYGAGTVKFKNVRLKTVLASSFPGLGQRLGEDRRWPGRPIRRSVHRARRRARR